MGQRLDGGDPHMGIWIGQRADEGLEHALIADLAQRFNHQATVWTTRIPQRIHQWIERRHPETGGPEKLAQRNRLLDAFPILDRLPAEEIKRLGRAAAHGGMRIVEHIHERIGA